MDLKELLGDAYKEGMTFDEITTALKDVKAPDPAPTNDAELERLKAAVSKANSEAADYKKQLKARMTEDEQKEAERAAKEAERDALLKSLQRDKLVSETTSQLLGIGYESDLATATAKAMAEGDNATVFANMKKHSEAVEQKVKADVLKTTPKPGKDAVPGAADYQKKIEEAQLNGDISAAAYYTRLAAQEETKPPTN